MIMPRGHAQLLLPASPWFIGGSLVLALAVQMLPIGRHPAWPDLLALVLVFWNVHQPRRVSLGVAFVFGLLNDVHEGALLGQYALSYTLLCFGATILSRRLLWFSVTEQAVQIFPLFLAAELVTLAVRLSVAGMFPGWSFLLAPVLQAALWPVASWVLLAPQRRAPDPDQNRPL